MEVPTASIAIGSHSGMLAGGIFKALQISNRRAALTRHPLKRRSAFAQCYLAQA
jgi:hypothetical protein